MASHDGIAIMFKLTLPLFARTCDAGAAPIGSGERSVFRNLSLGLVRHAVTNSSQRTYEGHLGFGCSSGSGWTCTLSSMPVLRRTRPPASWYSTLRTPSCLIPYNEQPLRVTCRRSNIFIWMACDVELEIVYPNSYSRLRGISRCHAEFGTRFCPWRLLLWPTLREGGALAPHWVPRGRVLRLALDVANVSLCARWTCLMRQIHVCPRRFAYGERWSVLSNRQAS